MKGTIYLLAVASNKNDKAEKEVFTNNAPFRPCISKINNTLVNNAQDLDINRPRYNLLEYTHNISMISGGLWNYYRDKIDDVSVHDSASDGKHLSIKQK